MFIHLKTVKKGVRTVVRLQRAVCSPVNLFDFFFKENVSLNTRMHFFPTVKKVAHMAKKD